MQCSMDCHSSLKYTRKARRFKRSTKLQWVYMYMYEVVLKSDKEQIAKRPRKYPAAAKRELHCIQSGRAPSLDQIFKQGHTQHKIIRVWK